MTLQYVLVATGEVLDVVELIDGRLRFETSVAEDLFIGHRERFGWTDTHLFRQLTGWSNGYLVVRSTL